MKPVEPAHRTGRAPRTLQTTHIPSTPRPPPRQSAPLTIGPFGSKKLAPCAHTGTHPGLPACTRTLFDGGATRRFRGVGRIGQVLEIQQLVAQHLGCVLSTHIHTHTRTRADPPKGCETRSRSHLTRHRTSRSASDLHTLHLRCPSAVIGTTCIRRPTPPTRENARFPSVTIPAA